MKIINGTITTPLGFKACGVHVGIRKEKNDLAMLISETPATAAACFTQNIVKGAPVLFSTNVLASGTKVKGFVVNSGNANTCVGPQGMADACAMAKTMAECFGGTADEYFVASTGVIGVPLPIEKIINGIKQHYGSVEATREAGTNAAQAILTTDTFVKEICVQLDIDGKTVTIGGMAKGSGMIHPNMATMLAFLTTDACICAETLQKMLTDSVADSYNMISVDGDTSTNDAIKVLANGTSGANIPASGENYEKFKAALSFVNTTLAKQIAKDGEGATKLIEVTINGAQTATDARKLALGVVSSNLFKAAMFGEDANWGRILAAMGRSGGSFNPNSTTVKFIDNSTKLTVMQNGTALNFDEDLASAILQKPEIFIDINVGDDNFSAKAWGCDLTYDYVKINGDYRS